MSTIQELNEDLEVANRALEKVRNENEDLHEKMIGLQSQEDSNAKQKRHLEKSLDSAYSDIAKKDGTITAITEQLKKHRSDSSKMQEKWDAEQQALVNKHKNDIEKMIHEEREKFEKAIQEERENSKRAINDLVNNQKREVEKLKENLQEKTAQIKWVEKTLKSKSNKMPENKSGTNVGSRDNSDSDTSDQNSEHDHPSSRGRDTVKRKDTAYEMRNTERVSGGGCDEHSIHYNHHHGNS